MSYKDKIAAARKVLEDKLPKEFSVVDLDAWSQVAKVASIELELGGVPLQNQRHLITSWASMATGVNLAISVIRTEHRNQIAQLRKEYESRMTDKDAISVSKTSLLESQKENAIFRALPHISREAERVLVAEEMAT